MNVISEQKLKKWFSEDEHRDWFAANIAFFDCPDSSIEEIYHFRWKVFRKHIRHTPDGHVVTEFLPDVHWAGKHNTISCAAQHHLYEGRWLRNGRPLDDYSRFWFRRGGSPRSYSAPLADAIYARALVTGDFALPIGLLPDLVANYSAWEDERLGDHGLFWQVDDREGEEFTIAGSGYRPPINSYMYGDALAIAAIARRAGNEVLAEEFTRKGHEIKAAVQDFLWDATDEFFKNRTSAAAVHAHNETYSWAPGNAMNEAANQLADVREVFGYLPWTYNLPDAGYEKAWRQLLDPQGFAAPFGPTTAERRHPRFMEASTHDCLWNGPSWPFVTTQVLKAMANLIHDYRQDEITRADYLRQLQTYARSHYRTAEDGSTVPWIDESLHPDTGAWLARESLLRKNSPDWDRGRDYNHSGFCDLVISGLCGLRPSADGSIRIDPLVPESAWDYWCLEGVPYHGHLLTVLYDRDGTRYGHGAGLRLSTDEGPFVEYDSMSQSISPGL